MKLTVFTPTYNRGELLKRVYASLKLQTSHEFIWLIVDDGSTDNTSEVIKALSSEAPFEIRYKYQENGGKMRAHNTGSAMCDTELFLCLDSDDILEPAAIEHILKCWNNNKEKRAGLVAYKGECSESLDELIKNPELFKSSVHGFRDAAFPAECVERGYSTLRGLYSKGFYGETTLVFAASYLKKYPFPEIEGEKYVPEDYIYDKIDSECPLIVLPKVFTVCELMQGGYTDQVARLRRENPTGWYLYYEQRARIEDWSVLKIKYISHYIIFSRLLGKEIKLSPLERGLGELGAAVLSILKKT